MKLWDSLRSIPLQNWAGFLYVAKRPETIETNLFASIGNLQRANLVTAVSRKLRNTCIHLETPSSPNNKPLKFKVLIHTWPEGSSLPVVIVMSETCESGQAAVVALPLPLLLLPFLLPPADLVVQLGPAVYFVRRLPGGQSRERNHKIGAMNGWHQAPTLTDASNRGGGGSARGLPQGTVDARKRLSVYFHVRALPISHFLWDDIKATVTLFPPWWTRTGTA